LSEIAGHVDLRNRPLVNVAIPGHEDPILALIDTGFNGYLLVHEDIAQRLCFISTGTTTMVEFAGHARRKLYVADGQIIWFGELTPVPVLVSTEDRPRPAIPDEPIALIGTGLLNPHKLVVDFASRQVLLVKDE
jgi:predicted aspartyl protease